jgi:hypothetical protein
MGPSLQGSVASTRPLQRLVRPRRAYLPELSVRGVPSARALLHDVLNLRGAFEGYLVAVATSAPSRFSAEARRRFRRFSFGLRQGREICSVFGGDSGCRPGEAGVGEPREEFGGTEWRAGEPDVRGDGVVVRWMNWFEGDRVWTVCGGRWEGWSRRLGGRCNVDDGADVICGCFGASDIGAGGPVACWLLSGRRCGRLLPRRVSEPWSVFAVKTVGQTMDDVVVVARTRGVTPTCRRGEQGQSLQRLLRPFFFLRFRLLRALDLLPVGAC